MEVGGLPKSETHHDISIYWNKKVLVIRAGSKHFAGHIHIKARFSIAIFDSPRFTKKMVGKPLKPHPFGQKHVKKPWVFCRFPNQTHPDPRC
jgi:hypothetical protein